MVSIQTMGSVEDFLPVGVHTAVDHSVSSVVVHLLGEHIAGRLFGEHIVVRLLEEDTVVHSWEG